MKTDGNCLYQKGSDLLSVVITFLIFICLFYAAVAAYAIMTFIFDRPFGRVWYYLVCYSFGALFTIRFLSLITVTNNFVNLFGCKIPVTSSFAKTKVFEILHTVCNIDSTAIMTTFYISVILYLLVLFIIKMTTNINAFRIKSVIYCFLLLALVSKTTKVGVSYEAYITLAFISVVLFIISFFGKNMLKNLKNSLKESIKTSKDQKKFVKQQSKYSNANETDFIDNSVNEYSGSGKLNGENIKKGDVDR